MINNIKINNKAKKNLKCLKKDFEILNDDNRLKILYLLRGEIKLCVCEIYDLLNISQNLASYHLTKLKDAGFLDCEKQGVKVIYNQNQKRINQFQFIINNLLNK